MNELERFLSAEGRRQARRPNLLQALLTDRPFAYARYRLQFMLARLVVRTALHAVEVYFLSLVLPFSYFAPLLLYRSVAALAQSTHWGALEELRTSVRALARARRPHEARRRVEAWLALSLLLGAAGLAAFALHAHTLRFPDVQGFSLFDAYGLACALRLFVELPARAFHSGIFALRRVYRPFGSMLAADVVELAIILFAYRALGPWSIPLAILSAGVLDAGLVVLYARKAYAASRLPMPRLGSAFRALRFLPRGTLGSALRGAAANATTQLDALLVLLLLRSPPLVPGQISFAVVYYVLRPFMAAGSHWSRAFYFDLHSVRSGSLRVLERRLHLFLRRLAVLTAVGLMLASALVAGLVFGGELSPSLLLLGPLFVARSGFALEQLEAFVSGRHAHLLRVSALTFGLLGVLGILRVSEPVLLLSATAILLFVSVVLRRAARAQPLRSDIDHRIVAVPRFISELSRVNEPVSVGFLSVARSLVSTVRVMRALTLPGCKVARVGRASLIFFVPGGLERTKVIEQSAGALRTLWTRERCADGTTALEALAQVPGGYAELSWLAPRAAPATSSLSTRLLPAFSQQFPEGTALDLRTRTGVLMARNLSPQVLAILLHEIVRVTRSRRTRSPDLPFELAVYAPHGEARVLFTAPLGSRGFARFRREVQLASAHDSFATSAPAPLSS